MDILDIPMDITVIPADNRDMRTNKTPPRRPSKFKISFNTNDGLSTFINFLKKSKIKPQIVSRKNLYAILSDVDYLMLDDVERFGCKVEEDFDLCFFGENRNTLVGFTKYTPVRKCQELHSLMELALERNAEKNEEEKTMLTSMICDRLLDLANGDTDGFPRIYESVGIVVVNDYCCSKVHV